MTRQVWHIPSPTACAAMPTISLMVGTPVGANLTLGRHLHEVASGRGKTDSKQGTAAAKRRFSAVLNGGSLHRKVNVQRCVNLNRCLSARGYRNRRCGGRHHMNRRQFITSSAAVGGALAGAQLFETRA